MGKLSFRKRKAASSKLKKIAASDSVVLEPASLVSFTKFPELPVDIRVLIWALAIDSIPLQGRELTVSAWGQRSGDIPRCSIAENWTKPWSEAIPLPFNSTELEKGDAAHGKAILEAINVQGPRIQNHMQPLLLSCRESRGEALRRYIRFSGNARRCDFHMFSDSTWPDQFQFLSKGRKKQAQIVGKSGWEYYQLDTKYSRGTYFNVEVDWLCFPSSSFRSVQPPYMQVSTLDETLGRWLPRQFFEKLRFLLLDMDNFKLHRERTKLLLLKFENLEEPRLFKVGIRFYRYHIPEPKPCLETEAFVQSLAEEYAGWKKPRVVYGRTRYGCSTVREPYVDVATAFHSTSSTG
ncbi:hypothetical protein IFR05_004611 [Cadophora sp. M221]|nr:hypothetical protein IFR05_004611 [Cadophora sp. M221]